MELVVKQISSLEKIREMGDIPYNEVTKKTLFCGEEFSYQITVYAGIMNAIKVSMSSPIEEFVELYAVRDTVVDLPFYKDSTDDDYLIRDVATMPDLLVPLSEQNGIIRTNPKGIAALWVKVKLPEGYSSGTYNINIDMTEKLTGAYSASKTMEIDLISKSLLEQKLIFTQWFHTDCIASAHDTAIYSEEHWDLIDKYMKMAGDLGINMILTPIITPPLDTEVGRIRPCTQLVRITRVGDKYSFDYTLLKRWIELAKKNGIKYFEMAHLFSQWGLKCAPNIVVNDEYLFGWDTPASSPEYAEFIRQFIPDLIEFLKAEDIKDVTYFHLSDEPALEYLENYRYAYELVTPLLDGCITMDAISDIDFYNEGLMRIPVTSTNSLKPFIEKNIENQWAYYCCAQYNKVGNRFMSMPQYRNRILGLQLYKYDIKGFLQWGYNFYYSQYSMYEINPYATSSSDGAFPSGDSYSVYPGKHGPMLSTRAVVFKEALQDIILCRMLEQYIGKAEVIKLIEDIAGMEITFEEYPRNNEFLPIAMDAVKKRLIECM